MDYKAFENLTEEEKQRVYDHAYEGATDETANNLNYYFPGKAIKDYEIGYSRGEHITIGDYYSFAECMVKFDEDYGILNPDQGNKLDEMLEEVCSEYDLEESHIAFIDSLCEELFWFCHDEWGQFDNDLVLRDYYECNEELFNFVDDVYSEYASKEVSVRQIVDALQDKFGEISDRGAYCWNGQWLSLESVMDAIINIR